MSSRQRSMEVKVPLLTILLLGLLGHQVSATVYYVDAHHGCKKYNGKSLDEPFATLQACVDALYEPGDECRIRAGRYHETVSIHGKYGSTDKPIIIAGYQNERPIIDGTVLLRPKWRRHLRRIFKAEIGVDIWQLFVGNEMMTNARWPNALWSDYTVFNNSYWAKSAVNSTPSAMTDDGEKNLAGSGIDATGALAVLNIGSFNTFVAKVLHHSKGSNSFTYNNTFHSTHFKPKMNQYFLEDKLELLDQPGEWYYDKISKTLYLWAPDGQNPKRNEVRGKTQTYGFTMTNSHHVNLENITFFATTLYTYSESATKYIDQLQFNSLNFRFPSYSKRMLGFPYPPIWTKILPNVGRYLGKSFKMFNCTFYGTDGAALQFNGENVTLQNNLFEYNDWSGAMLNVSSGGLGTIISMGTGDRFIRNTVRFNGASSGYRLGGRGNYRVELNHFHHQCWGRIQNDGSHVQTQIGAQTNTMLTQNWIHDSPKYALRFDGQPPRVGRHGTMSSNVAMNTNGIMVKGDYHKVINNLALDKYTDAGGDRQGNGCVLCVLRYVRTNPVPINNNTIVLQNGAQTANGGKRGKKFYPLAGKEVKYNVIGNVRKQVVDADNFDFRVVKDSKYIEHDVGPYSYVEKMTKYWIPGRQLFKATTPIPPNHSTVTSSRDALMWLNAYGANRHQVYVGKSVDSLDFKGTLEDESNVYLLQNPLETGQVYYWRVDAEVSSTVIYQGDIWSFSVKQ